MKKSNFAALLLGTVSSVLFALGVCMTLIPQWDSFQSGIVLGCAGIISGMVTLLVWRKMEQKPPIRISGKALLTTAAGIAGTLALGAGMCFSMVWDQMIVGISIGLVGVAILLCLIPLTKGIKN